MICFWFLFVLGAILGNVKVYGYKSIRVRTKDRSFFRKFLV